MSLSEFCLLARCPSIFSGRAATLQADMLKPLFDKWLKQPPPNAGAAADFFDWNLRNIKKAHTCGLARPSFSTRPDAHTCASACMSGCSRHGCADTVLVFMP